MWMYKSECAEESAHNWNYMKRIPSMWAEEKEKKKYVLLLPAVI